MEWLEDPEARRRYDEALRSLTRSSIIWTPFAVAAIGALLFFLVDILFLDRDNGSTWFLIVVLSLFSFLFGSQAFQALTDRFAQPRLLTGVVTRRWSKLDSFVMRTFYVRIDRQILRGETELLKSINPGDTVAVRYFPHSALIVTATRVEVPKEQADAAAGQAPSAAATAPPPPPRGRRKLAGRVSFGSANDEDAAPRAE
jgi:hypothetical protein